jgi:GNAT superfamily N-acetyltransferase
MTSDDVAGAAAVALEALPGTPTPERVRWLQSSTARLLASDPEGAWVAEDEGGIVQGMASSIVRDGLWVLSRLAVRPDVHARGIGGRLLEQALVHARLADGGLIASSTDPKAMRLYARADFDLQPSVSLSGMLDRAAIPGGLLAKPSDDVEAMAPLGKPVRGAAYGPADLAMLLARPGAAGFLVEGRGFAIHIDGSPVVLVADGGGIAQDLLWSCLAAAKPGASVDIDFVVAGNDWAIEVGLEARLALTPQGPIFTRGDVGPLRAWIPSGSLL